MYHVPYSIVTVSYTHLAKGDGETDDTEVFEKAVSLHKNIYVPQGWYRLTRTLKLSTGTKLIGLHPFGTQFLVKESEPACSGFGVPVPWVEMCIRDRTYSADVELNWQVPFVKGLALSLLGLSLIHILSEVWFLHWKIR